MALSPVGIIYVMLQYHFWILGINPVLIYRGVLCVSVWVKSYFSCLRYICQGCKISGSNSSFHLSFKMTNVLRLNFMHSCLQLMRYNISTISSFQTCVFLRVTIAINKNSRNLTCYKGSQHFTLYNTCIFSTTANH